MKTSLRAGPFCRSVHPDWQSLLSCIRREGTPARVHFIELFLDDEVQNAICERFALVDDLDRGDPFFEEKRQIALQRFLGYDFVACRVRGTEMSFSETPVEDTSTLKRAGGRKYMEEHRGPITTWEEFEAYPWPDISRASTRSFEWYEKNLPDDMCLLSYSSHFLEHLSWLMGYESLCYALYDQRDLVEALSQRITAQTRAEVEFLLQFDRIKIIWGSDDMGFRSGTLISPADLREFVLPGHRMVARMAHAAGRLYLLHSCGRLQAIMSDLINDVGIDGLHSFEDTIITVAEAKVRYGSQIALLGGIDMDFLCRASEEQVRQRVRETLEQCQIGGGYCLGTGNTVANYVPIPNYLAMLDEGRKYTRI